MKISCLVSYIYPNTIFLRVAEFAKLTDCPALVEKYIAD